MGQDNLLSNRIVSKVYIASLPCFFFFFFFFFFFLFCFLLLLFYYLLSFFLNYYYHSKAGLCGSIFARLFIPFICKMFENLSAIRAVHIYESHSRKVVHFRFIYDLKNLK